jgi:hypothetical protein
VTASSEQVHEAGQQHDDRRRPPSAISGFSSGLAEAAVRGQDFWIEIHGITFRWAYT